MTVCHGGATWKHPLYSTPSQTFSPLIMRLITTVFDRCVVGEYFAPVMSFLTHFLLWAWHSQQWDFGFIRWADVLCCFEGCTPLYSRAKAKHWGWRVLHKDGFSAGGVIPCDPVRGAEIPNLTTGAVGTANLHCISEQWALQRQNSGCF